MKELLLNNIGKKVLAISIAIILWIISNFEQDIVKNISIDIRYDSLPKELIITNIPPEKLNLRVRGSRTKLSILRTDNYSFPINLSKVNEGLSKFDIITEQITIPGIQIIGLSPSEIKVETDTLITKIIKVNPNIGIPDIDFELVGLPRVDPKSVKISGPKSLLSKLEYIDTDLVSIEGEKTNFTIEVRLKTTSPLINLLEDEKVKITVDIKETIIEKEFKNININFKNFDDIKYKVLSDQDISLLFKGPYRKIKNLSSGNIEVIADAKNLKSRKPNKYSIKLDVEYPGIEEIVLDKINPENIEILIVNDK